jgi:hypothetical protein
MRRKLILGALALSLPLATAVSMGAGSATASSNVTGTGTYSCKVLTGTITFSPPLTNTAKIETTTVNAVAKTCSGTAKPAVLSATSKSKTTGTKPSSCTTLVSATTAVKFATTYSPVVTPSTFTGTAKGGTSGSSAVFDVTGKVTGSYPSALAKAHAVIKETIPTILGLCNGSGVSTLHIASGTVTTN